MGLSGAEAAVVAAVVRGREAWSRWDELERGHGGAVLAALVAAGVLERWARPDYLAVTLTPWGAFAAGVEIEEVWRPGVEERSERDGSRPLAETEVRRERVMVETPRWVESRPGARPKPVRLPGHARIGSTLAAPERVAAPEPPRDEWLLDGDGNEVRLFAGPGGKGGWPVRVSRRRP